MVIIFVMSILQHKRKVAYQALSGGKAKVVVCLVFDTPGRLFKEIN